MQYLHTLGQREDIGSAGLTGILSSASFPTVTSASTLASFGSGFASLWRLP
jgi:hypothetical protein